MKTSRRPRRGAVVMSVVPLLIAAVLASGGCRAKVNSGVGFQLPEGDPELGRQAFIDLKCYACHTVEGVDLPKPMIPSADVIMLGGEVTQVRTYGRLMTAIVHPTASLSSKYAIPPGAPPPKSPMPTLNETMTVAELVNLITFLQPHYRELKRVYQTSPNMLP